MTEIADNILKIKNKIHDYELGLSTARSVFLLAVSKGQSIEKIKEAILAGQKAFGENYLQEALVKMASFSEEKIEWHFVGTIQGNKTKKIAEHFQWVQTISDKKIAKRLNDQRPDYLPPLNICIQVNVTEEKTKSGVKLDDLFSLAEYCIALPRLKLRGLMTISEQDKDLEAKRHTFEKLAEAYQALNEKNFRLDTLSMGMSDDMAVAIESGATMVRIGSAIFGTRL